MGLTPDLFESDLREDWATVQNDRKHGHYLPKHCTFTETGSARLRDTLNHPDLSSIFRGFTVSALWSTRCRTPFLNGASMRSRSMFSKR